MRYLLILTLLVLPVAAMSQSWTEIVITDAYDEAWGADLVDVDGDGDLDVVASVGYYMPNVSLSGVVWWENTGWVETAWTVHGIDGRFVNTGCIKGVDMDRDGDADILGAADREGVVWWENLNGNGVGWRIHKVDLGPTSGRKWPSFGANDACAADIDGDDDLDIFGSCKNSRELLWWENIDGSGSQWIAHPLAERFATQVFLADLDNDGDPDALAAPKREEKFVWWENNQGGSEWMERPIDLTVGFTTDVYADDVDQDGDIDVLSVSVSDDIIWWENVNSKGTWPKRIITSRLEDAWGIIAADINSDGFPDAVTCANGVNDISWWGLTDSKPPSWSKHTIDDDYPDPVNVVSGDLNNDGLADLLSVSGEGSIHGWIQQPGNNTSWIPHTIPNRMESNFPSEFNDVEAIRAVDINNDGDMDVIAAGSHDAIKLWENESAADNSWNEYLIGKADYHAVNDLEVADMDNDGDLDILNSCIYLDYGVLVYWWENDGLSDHNWNSHKVFTMSRDDKVRYADSFSSNDLHPADLDGDGDLDIAASMLMADKSFFVWFENSDGAATTWINHMIEEVSSVGWNLISSADIDNDGDTDVIGTEEGTGLLAWWDNAEADGTIWFRNQISRKPVAAMIAYDIDRDGDEDILTASREGELAWLENAEGGGLSWIDHTVDSGLKDVSDVYATDLDNDGDVDFMCAMRDGNSIIWWENTDDTGTSWQKHSGAFEGSNCVRACDIDGDGDMDLIGAAARDEGFLIWWERFQN